MANDMDGLRVIYRAAIARGRGFLIAMWDAEDEAFYGLLHRPPPTCRMWSPSGECWY